MKGRVGIRSLAWLVSCRGVPRPRESQKGASKDAGHDRFPGLVASVPVARENEGFTASSWVCTTSPVHADGGVIWMIGLPPGPAHVRGSARAPPVDDVSLLGRSERLAGRRGASCAFPTERFALGSKPRVRGDPVLGSLSGLASCVGRSFVGPRRRRSWPRCPAL